MTVTEYIAKTLVEKLERYGVVVFYDPPGDMREALNALPADVKVLVYDSSYFQIKLEAETRYAALRPGFKLAHTLLIYVPAKRIKKEEDPLAEYWLAGTAFEDGLPAIARKALEGKLSRAEVDELFDVQSPPTLAQLDQWSLSPTIDSGALPTIYGTKDVHLLLVRFLSQPELDSKVGLETMQRFLKQSIGLQSALVTHRDVREQTWKHILLSGLAEDLGEQAKLFQPVKLNKDQRTRIGTLLQYMGKQYPELYREAAAQVETAERLSDNVEGFGTQDLFAFQNTRALQEVVQIATKDPEQGAIILENFKEGFWNPFLEERSVAWQVAKLALSVLRLLHELEGPTKNGKGLSGLVSKYIDPEGWHKIDTAQRELEQAAHTIPQEVESLVHKTREAYGRWLDKLNQNLFAAYDQEGLELKPLRPQQRIFAEVVEPHLTQGPVAYFLLDALRYEMAVVLREMLTELGQVHLEARSGMLPSITPVGMAALLPGAQLGLGLSANGTPKLGEVELPDWAARKRIFQNYLYEKFAECRIEDLPTAEKLSKELKKGIRLLVVRMQDIDELGEADLPEAQALMGSLLGKVRRAVRTVLEAGFKQIVITADHGFVLLPALSSGLVQPPESPRRTAILSKRRCWLGHPQSRPSGAWFIEPVAVGLESSSLGGAQLAFPKGIGLFQNGGNTLYYHGGPSLQERLIPVLTLQGKRIKGVESGFTLEASLGPSPDGKSLIALLRLKGQSGLGFGQPTRVQLECKAADGSRALLVYPASPSGELIFPDNGVITAMLQPSGPLEQAWELVIRHELSSEGELRTAWEASPSSRKLGKEQVWPQGLLEPPKDCWEVVRHILKVRQISQPDLDTYLKQQNAPRSVNRALQGYLDELAQNGRPAILRDMTVSPPVIRVVEENLR